MRKTRILGAIAAGALALTLGAGPASASPTQHKDHAAHGVSQKGSNDNSTDQSANSQASTYQKNINKSFSFLTFGSGNGDVQQSNWANTQSKAENWNSTEQSLQQKQFVKD